jgi:hypothetical protein
MHAFMKHLREKSTASAAERGLLGFLLKLVSWALVAHPDQDMCPQQAQVMTDQNQGQTPPPDLRLQWL